MESATESLEPRLLPPPAVPPKDPEDHMHAYSYDLLGRLLEQSEVVPAAPGLLHTGRRTWKPVGEQQATHLMLSSQQQQYDSMGKVVLKQHRDAMDSKVSGPAAKCCVCFSDDLVVRVPHVLCPNSRRQHPWYSLQA